MQIVPCQPEFWKSLSPRIYEPPLASPESHFHLNRSQYVEHFRGECTWEKLISDGARRLNNERTVVFELNKVKNEELTVTGPNVDGVELAQQQWVGLTFPQGVPWLKWGLCLLHCYGEPQLAPVSVNLSVRIDVAIAINHNFAPIVWTRHTWSIWPSQRADRVEPAYQYCMAVTPD